MGKEQLQKRIDLVCWPRVRQHDSDRMAANIELVNGKVQKRKARGRIMSVAGSGCW